jgi:hypothetical protein
LNLLLVTFHFENTPHLYKIHLFPITHAYDLIKCAKELKALLLDFALISGAAHIRHNTREQMEGVNILENVGSLVGDEKDIEVFEWLVDIADLSSFDGGVLRVCGNEFGEGGEERFDVGTRHGVKLAREHRCRGVLRDRRRRVGKVHLPFPPFVHIDAARTTCALLSSVLLGNEVAYHLQHAFRWETGYTLQPIVVSCRSVPSYF